MRNNVFLIKKGALENEGTPRLYSAVDMFAAVKKFGSRGTFEKVELVPVEEIKEMRKKLEKYELALKIIAEGAQSTCTDFRVWKYGHCAKAVLSENEIIFTKNGFKVLKPEDLCPTHKTPLTSQGACRECTREISD